MIKKALMSKGESTIQFVVQKMGEFFVGARMTMDNAELVICLKITRGK